MKSFTREEVASHNSAGNAFVRHPNSLMFSNENCKTIGLQVIVDEKVYDVSKFYKMHPGGAALLLEHAGKVYGFVLFLAV